MNKDINLEICNTETIIARELRKLENLAGKKIKTFELLNRDFTLENGKETEGLKPLIELDK